VVITAGSAAESLQNKDISIHDISLLLFDECHKAKGESDYCKILNHYLRAKEPNLPQVTHTGMVGTSKCSSQKTQC
jgi:ERCC4-related helicase